MFNRNKGKKDKGPFYKRWWFIALAVVFIIGAISGDDEEIDTAAETDNTEIVDDVDAEDVEEEPEEIEEVEEVEEEEPEETFANNFEKEANEVFGDKLVEVSVDLDGEEHLVKVTANLAGGWNEKTMRDAFFTNVADLAESVSAEEFDRLVVDGQASMQDKLGNAKEMKVLTVNLTKELITKINFDNFNPKDFPDVADAIFIHPAFMD